MIRKIILSITITIFIYALYEIFPYGLDIIVQSFVPEEPWKYGLLEFLIYVSILLCLVIPLFFIKNWRLTEKLRNNFKVIPLALLVIIIFRFIIYPFMPITYVNRELNHYLLVFGIFNIVILQPVIEELLFRHILFKVLNPNRKNLVVYVLLSSFLFSAFHFNPININLQYLFVILLLGMILALIYLKAGFFGSLIGHVVYNLIFVLKRFFDIDVIFLNNTYISLTLIVVMFMLKVIFKKKFTLDK